MPWHLQVLEIAIKDSRITGRSSVGVVRVPLRSLPEGGRLNAWLPVVGNHARGGVSPLLPARPASVLLPSRVQPDSGSSVTCLLATQALPTATQLSASCIVCCKPPQRAKELSSARALSHLSSMAFARHLMAAVVSATGSSITGVQWTPAHKHMCWTVHSKP